MELTRVESYAPVRVHAKTWLVVVACCIAYFAQLVGVVGSGLLANGISTYFRSPYQGVWLSSAITILTVVLGPPVSQIADLWGRKWPLVVCLTGGAVGSIVASRAQSMGTVIAGFTILATCFGAQALIHAVVSEILPRKHRPMAQATINMTAGIGALVGICMGGALFRHNVFSNYRVYMYVTTGIFAAAALAVALCYNPPQRELQMSLTTKEKLGRLDWIGYVLFAPGLVLFCVALSWSKNPYPWSNGRIIGTFVVGVVLVIAFFIFEWRFKKDGLLHHDLFKRGRTFPIALLVVFAEGVGFFSANSWFAYEVSVLTGADFLISGLHFGVTFLTATVFAFLTGIYSGKMKAIRVPMVVGFLCCLVYFICMATSGPSTPSAAFWIFGVILGAGVGILLPTIMVAAQLSTPPDLIAEASALVLATRSLGGTVGLAVNNAIFTSEITTQIPTRVAAAVLPLGLPPTSIKALIGALAAQDQALLMKVPGVSPRIIGAAVAALQQAYSASFRYCWVFAAAITFVAAVASLFFFDPKDEFNAHIDAPAEQKLIEEQAAVEHERGLDTKHGSEKVEVMEK